MSFDPLVEDWKGRAVYLIGGGPSLRGFDFERLHGCGVVVAINDAFRAVPWADAAFSIDTVWIERRAAELRNFAGEKIGVVPPEFGPREAGWRYVRRIPGPGVAHDPAALCTGFNSGYAALAMALARGAGAVALLGYDMSRPGHFHAGYEWRSRYGSALDYRRWVSLFPYLAALAESRGVRVVNCNPASGIRFFKFGEPEEIAEAVHA